MIGMRQYPYLIWPETRLGDVTFVGGQPSQKAKAVSLEAEQFANER
jgi:hypothetical protein